MSAYLLLMEKGESGKVYNICSGVGRTLREVLEAVARIVGIGINVSVDPARIRPADNHVIVGSNEKMIQLGWTLKHSLESSIRDMVAHVESCGANI